MGMRNMVLNMVGLSMIAMAFMNSATAATEYTVGDGLGWHTPTNVTFYQDWAANKTFFVGDVLVFNLTGNVMVSEVSKAEYDNCTNVISGVAGTENAAAEYKVTLKTSVPRYFIDPTDNHCVRGQKLSINVESTNSSGASLLQPHHSALGIFATLLALYFLTNAH